MLDEKGLATLVDAVARQTGKKPREVVHIALEVFCRWYLQETASDNVYETKQPKESLAIRVPVGLMNIVRSQGQKYFNRIKRQLEAEFDVIVGQENLNYLYADQKTESRNGNRTGIVRGSYPR